MGPLNQQGTWYWTVRVNNNKGMQTSNMRFAKLWDNSWRYGVIYVSPEKLPGKWLAKGFLRGFWGAINNYHLRIFKGMIEPHKNDRSLEMIYSIGFYHIIHIPFHYCIYIILNRVETPTWSHMFCCQFMDHIHCIEAFVSWVLIYFLQLSRHLVLPVLPKTLPKGIVVYGNCLLPCFTSGE